MKNLIFHIGFMVIFTGSPVFAQLKIVDVRGDIMARYGVQQEWFPVRVGEELRPEDSMRSGKGSSATMAVDGSKRVIIPEDVIVDLSDFRTLTQDDLLLRLAMERVLAVPPRERPDRLQIPQTTIIHGEEKTSPGERRQSRDTGMLELNGTRVLFSAGYYGTCAVRGKEILRLHPELSRKVDARLMIASALEKENLEGEALTEYLALSNEVLSRPERALVEAKIAELKKEG